MNDLWDEFSRNRKSRFGENGKVDLDETVKVDLGKPKKSDSLKQRTTSKELPGELHTKKESTPATPEPSVDLRSRPKTADLDPEVKQATDVIYRIDPRKFDRLIGWVKQAEKYKFDNPVIAEALRRFKPYASATENWWPYLDKIIAKAEKDMNVAEHNRKHDEHKIDRQKAGSLLQGLGFGKGIVKDAN